VLSTDRKPPAPSTSAEPRSPPAPPPAPAEAAPPLRGAGAASASTPLSRALANAVAERCDATPQLARRATFKTADDAYVHPELLLELLRARSAILPSEADRLFVQELSPDVARAAFRRLTDSAEQYGTFDLRSDQDLLLLYFELRKHVHKPEEAEEPTTEVRQSSRRATKARYDVVRYLQDSPAPTRTYDLALLGTGASIAYYVTSHAHEIDGMQTVAIGKRQPWAHERGPGVVNHPMHMITPRRDDVGLGDESLQSRTGFSDVVADVLGEHVGRTIDANIKSVTRIPSNGRWFYAIVVDIAEGEERTFYARKVVFGLGIGGHVMPRPREGSIAAQDSLGGRAMNMDEFQRRAAEIAGGADPRPDITVVITGPNAGLDAVKTALGCGFTIIWVTGSGRPGFLPGTDNELVEAEYDRLENHQPSAIAEVIKDYAYLAIPNPDTSGGAKPIVVDTGRAGQERAVPADYFVWAMGPNVAQVKRIFGDQFGELVPSYDDNRQFGADGTAAVTGLERGGPREQSDETSLVVIGGSAFRLADAVGYDYLRRRDAESRGEVAACERIAARYDREDRGPVSAAMGRLCTVARDYVEARRPDLVAIEEARAAPAVPANIPQLTLDPDLATVEAVWRTRPVADAERARLAQDLCSALRHVREYGTALAVYRAQVADYYAALGRREKPTDPRKAGGQMGKVIGSLPLNVLVNDQLTPSRSQVEATAAFVPGYVREDANFATDSATVLAIHIATRYPHLSDLAVDTWVETIMRWRRPSGAERAQDALRLGPIPDPNGAGREDARRFSTRVKALLAAADLEAKSRL
jgi:hypothetical protein